MNHNVGLCLAGGGVKGAAHIGAIKALEESNIKFDYIGGTSSRKYSSLFICYGFPIRRNISNI